MDDSRSRQDDPHARQDDARARQDWMDLATHPALAVLLDLDDTLLSARDNPVDRGLAMLLDALHAVDVHVVFVSKQPLQLAARVNGQAPHVQWICKTTRSTKDVVTRLRDRIAGLRVIAIGDTSADDASFEALDLDERALAIRIEAGRRPSAVRAMLWWLVETRRGIPRHVLS